jgi:LmbE family N-acetylglucosaminyl deacetylase
MTGSVVFFHAHPDDEAIFTGGTMARLAAAGWRVVLVLATAGESGVAPAGLDTGPGLADIRRAETARAARALGLARVDFLGYHDSGLAGDPGDTGPDSFYRAEVETVAAQLGAVLVEEAAAALVIYDEHGIYGHPDHVMVHRAGVMAAARAGVATVYQATVDREYLHFVETHLVVEAKRATGELGLAASRLGVPTVLVTTTVDVRGVLETKRAAMAAHASQIPETTGAMQLPTEAFSAVYGFEWFVRSGPSGPLDELLP